MDHPRPFSRRGFTLIELLVVEPHPYIYRENRSRASRPWMRRPETADIYSTGRDGIDQTLQCKTGDDLGNW